MSRSIPPFLQAGFRQAGNAPAGPGPTRFPAERRVADRRRPVLDCRRRDFRLQAAVEAAGVGIYDLDAVTRRIHWSPELKAIAGVAGDPDEISLERLASLLHPLDRGRVMRKVEASLDPKGDGLFEDEHRLVRPDGSVRWAKVRGQSFFAGEADERHALGASGIVVDVTERKAAEALLLEQSQELRLALRVGNSGTFQWDARTHEHRWCDEMLALYGLERGEFGGGDEDWLACLVPEDRGHAMAAVERSLKIGEYATAFRIRRRNDGEIRWVSARGQVFFDPDGCPVRMVGINVDITAQKRDQERLQESEARFRRMADAAPAFVWVAGTDRGWTWFNEPWLAFSGRKLEQELGYGWARALHPDDAVPTLQIYEAAFDRREPFSTECRMCRHDGEYRWLLVQGIPRLEGDTFVGYVGSAIDITDYKQAQSCREENRVRMEAILDSLSEGVVIFDLEGLVLNMNPAARRMLRYATPEEARRRLPEFTETFDVRSLDGRSLPLNEWPIGRVIRGESFTDYEILLYRKEDGSTRIISHNGTPVRGPSGDIIVGLLTLWDVTERKQDEEALRRESSRLQSILDNAPVLISIKDLHGRMALANRAIFDTVDVPPPERFIGRSDFELFPEDMARQLWDNDLRALEADAPIRAEEQVRHKDGSVHTYLTVKFPVRDVCSGKTRSICAISVDITERKAAEAKIMGLNNELEQRVQERTAELRRANEALLQSNMELKHFAHATAHDLQTPLRSIAGFTQLLQREVHGQVGERVDQLSSLVVENTKRLQDVIRELLSYTRLETEGLPSVPVDLRRLADDVLASLAVLIEERGAEVSCGDLPNLPADRAQLALVLQNLIENAIKYNESTPPRVAIGAELHGNEWVVSVADNGIGVAPKYHERIFEIFGRLHAYHQVPGTGIGLALCRRIVERHGGRIWVESRPGAGSTFRFTLPARTPAVSAPND